jgi:two-component sensor histidine kinase
MDPPSTLNKINHLNLSYPFADSDGFIWVTSNEGVIRIDKDGGVRKFGLSRGLGTNFATSYFEDCEGNIWLQTDGYIKFFNKAVDIYSKNEGLSLSPVYSIAEDSSHSIWIAQADAMTNMTNNNIYKFNYPLLDRNPDIIPRIMIQGDSLWLAYYGLWLFKIHSGSRPRIYLEKRWLSWHQKKLIFGHDMCLYTDGTPLIDFDGDIYRVSKKGVLQRVIAGTQIFRFLVSGDEMWTGPLGYGITRWRITPLHDSLKSQLIRQYNDIPGLRVLSLSKDSCNNIWAGTLYKGVIKLEKQDDDSFAIRNYDIHNGLPGNEVSRLFIDHTGRIFINTSQGFCLLHTEPDSVRVENLNNKYGFYGSLWDMNETKNGDLWLAAQSGAVRIKTMQAEKKVAPRIFITGMLCNNSPDTSFEGDSKVHSFSYKQDNLSFEFTATSFKNEAEVSYSYQLHSAKDDTSWSQPKKIHQVSFASLSPGRYIFKVKALNTDGQWSKSPAEYNFTITPPYYQTWWFRTTIILLAVGSISGLYRYRLSQVKKLLALRTKISRDLHDEIGSTLSSINILSKISLSNVEKDSAKSSQLLEKIAEQSQSIQQSMSDIVWAIRPDKDKLENMAVRMREYLGQAAEASDLKVEFHIDDHLLKESLTMQQRKDLFLIFKEAVNNAVKYSGGKNIVIFLGKQDHYLKLLVKDDGVGFDPTNITSSSGLKNMRDRARDLNGTLSIQSSLGEGTSVEFIGWTA